MLRTEQAYLDATKNSAVLYTVGDCNTAIRESLHNLTIDNEPTILDQFMNIPRASASKNASENTMEALSDLELEFPSCEVVASIKVILTDDMYFGATKFKSSKKRLALWDDGIAKLKALNHPRLMFTENKYWIISNEQEAALYRDAPTCNYCKEEMHQATGKYGKFYFCGSKCKHQKTISDSYWQSVKRNK
ncbi:hypothetical protein LMH73_018155 [Vibrio splendidus]|nr:hypothetical protein [Vibrio splendidus]MCC4882938.1 hypothetical protein [Vibrio splendidus]